jgi:thymidylate synthase
MKSIYIKAGTLPEAWEQAVVKCWENGESFVTEYDKNEDPPSKDITIMLHIESPMVEPRIHRAFPGGLDDLEKYRSEVLYGVHDHWINADIGKWEYTYHQRLMRYDTYKFVDHEVNIIYFNQIFGKNGVIEKLRRSPCTRRAQAITWMPGEDEQVNDPPCLQRLWFRIENNKLNMNVHMRSSDAFKASFMNLYAFTELQLLISQELNIDCGECIFIADSFHIYGSYFKEFEGFLDTIKNRSKEERTWNTSFAIPMFIEGCNILLAEKDMPIDKKELIEQRKKELQKMEK